jgi:hypothetical protein
MNIVTAIISSFAAALALLFSFVPRFIGFLVILLIGWLIATAISKAVTFLLRKVGFDRLAERIGLSRIGQQSGVTLDAAGILGKIVYWFLFLIFLVPAVDALGLTAVSTILNQLIAYLPNVFVALLILFLGTFAATIAADIVRGATSKAKMGNPNLFANLARYAIIGFVTLMALEQLGIAPALLNILFTAIVGAAALAAALAFGLGGQETARTYLARTERATSQAATQMQQNGTQEQAQTLAPTVRDVPRTR